jgi:transcriptional regulator with XRE-family HTH domain
MTDHAERLFALSQEQADKLGKTLTDIAQEAGVSPQALYQWRKGRKRLKEKTDRAISRAFEWEYGARQDVLEGRDPTPIRKTLPRPEAKIFDDPIEQALWELAAPEDERLYLIGAYRLRGQLQPLVDAWRQQHGRAIDDSA